MSMHDKYYPFLIYLGVKHCVVSFAVEPEEFEVNMKKLTSYVLSQQHMMECLQVIISFRNICFRIV